MILNMKYLMILFLMLNYMIENKSYVFDILDIKYHISISLNKITP